MALFKEPTCPDTDSCLLPPYSVNLQCKDTVQHFLLSRAMRQFFRMSHSARLQNPLSPQVGMSKRWRCSPWQHFGDYEQNSGFRFDDSHPFRYVVRCGIGSLGLSYGWYIAPPMQNRKIAERIRRGTREKARQGGLLPPSSGCKPVGTTPRVTFRVVVRPSGEVEIEVAF